ncbi:MAG: response regulator [Elusimicrobiota bacterium]
MTINNKKGGPPEKQKGKILVIDDENDIRAAFKAVLGGEGFTVITAADGAEGALKNTEHNPDVIILDLKMPKMSGMETLRLIRETDKAVRVIILTGYGEAGSIREAENLGVFEYASKPFRNATIIDTVKEALTGR